MPGLKFTIHKERFREDHYLSEARLSISLEASPLIFKFLVDKDYDQNVRLAVAELKNKLIQEIINAEFEEE